MVGAKDMLLRAQAELSGQLDRAHVENAKRREALAESEKQVTDLQRQLRGIEVALKAMADEEAKPSGSVTIMQAVLEVMREKGEPMTARDILNAINRNHFAGSIRRSSLSPQLSRLKDRDRKIDLDGDKWFLLPEEPSLFATKK